MDEESDSEKSMLASYRSDSKIARDKRGSSNFEEKHDVPHKRVKMRDLESITHSAECNIRNSEPRNHKNRNVHRSSGEKEMSQISKVPVTMDVDTFEEAKSGRNAILAESNPAPRNLALNSEACGARYSSLDKSGGCVDNLIRVSLSEKREREQRSSLVKSKGINVDLNADDVNSSINLESAHSQKGRGHFKSKDVSESGSCTGPIEEKDPMRIWKEMKQNGFLSSSHGGIPNPAPKPRGRKSKNDMLKKKMELAKREQVNKFTKIAAPSGLLNDLNPGIINHVRNKKQVHSIIEALVRSENNENSSTESKQAASHRMSGSTEVSKRDPGNMTDVGRHQRHFSHEEGTLHSSLGNKQARKSLVTVNDSSGILNDKVGDDETETCTIEKNSQESCASHSTHVLGDETLALKLSSSTNVSMSSTNLSEEPSNFTIVSSLSLKAATVASQWLELLHQDFKGRLSALRRSRRRVQSVINTELPFLISKELANNQENDPHITKISAELSSSKTTDLHKARWTALFERMDEELSEEERQLESWLNQVKEKQLLCDQGLHHVNWSTAYGLQQLGAENDSRVSTIDSSERELAVNAAAASIYSTCNFLLS